MWRPSLLVLLLLLFVPVAGAWTWPVQGPVLQTFSFDQGHPFAAGQHRGIAIGAADGAPVLAPAAGVVSFAGTVPTNGKTITIQTPSGLAVSLTHLGSIGVARTASVDEGTAVGTVGPSGTPEFDVPYVHLGVRDAANDQGYLDPLAFLPVLTPPPAATEPQPQPAPAPAPPVDVPAATPVTPVAPPAVAQPVADVPAPVQVAPGQVPAAPQPVSAPAEPVAPAVPAVEAPAPSPSVPLEPSVPEKPVAGAPVPVHAVPALGSLPALPVTSPGPVVAVAAGAPAATLPGLAFVPSTAARAGSDAVRSTALSPAFSLPELRHRPAASPALGPLPVSRLLSTAATAPSSHGFIRVLPLGLAASLAAAGVAVLLLRLRRRRPPPAPVVRLRAVHAVHSADHGRLAA